MANQVVGVIQNTDTAFNLTQASVKLTFDALKAHPLLNNLLADGVINQEDALKSKAGDTVNMYNELRVDSAGYGAGGDAYAEAENFELGSRSLVINELNHSGKVPKDDTMTAQRSAIKLGQNAVKRESDWMKAMITHSIINQLSGNVATSIQQPDVWSGTFTGNTLSRITGFNPVVAVSSQYRHTGGGTNVTDANVTSAHKLTLNDFMDVDISVSQTYNYIPRWNCIMGKSYNKVAIISMTALDQLLNESAGTDKENTFSRYYNNLLSAGQLGDASFQDFVMPTVRTRFIVLPDNYLPRGVDSGAEVPNTRKAIICGEGALDLAFGRASKTKSVANISVTPDTNYKPLNGLDFYKVTAIMGCKRAQLNGTGINANNLYDHASYTITHYSES